MQTARERLWDGPWPWLAYLIFLPMPWIWRWPDPLTLILTALAVALFLPIYVFAHRVRDRRLIAASAAITALGLALALRPVGWTVFPIYAAAVLGRAQPPRAALIGVALIAAATTVTGLALAQPTLWWLAAVLLILLTGASTVSREAFYRRTQALLASQEEVRRLAGTAERERIARDLHDVIGRTLTLIALKADLGARLLDRDPAAAGAEIEAIAVATRAGLAEVRAALAGQAGGGLVQEAAASLAALRTAGVEPVLTGDPATVPANAGAVLAMTLREAVTNVIRHAGARRCTIAIVHGGAEARLTVSDDGIGLGAGLGGQEGNGLAGMRQRLVAAGGALALAPLSPGLRIEARVPA